MDMTAIAGLVSAIASATDTITGLINKRPKESQELSDLKASLLTAFHTALSFQQAAAAAQEEAAQLKSRIAELEDFGQKRASYTLQQVAPGCFVYRDEAAVTGNQPAPYICAHCIEDHKVSILFPAAMSGMVGFGLTCPRCKSELPAGEII